MHVAYACMQVQLYSVYGSVLAAAILAGATAASSVGDPPDLEPST